MDDDDGMKKGRRKIEEGRPRGVFLNSSSHNQYCSWLAYFLAFLLACLLCSINFPLLSLTPCVLLLLLRLRRTTHHHSQRERVQSPLSKATKQASTPMAGDWLMGIDWDWWSLGSLDAGPQLVWEVHDVPLSFAWFALVWLRVLRSVFGGVADGYCSGASSPIQPSTAWRG